MHISKASWSTGQIHANLKPNSTIFIKDSYVYDNDTSQLHITKKKEEYNSMIGYYR